MHVLLVKIPIYSSNPNFTRQYSILLANHTITFTTPLGILEPSPWPPIGPGIISLLNESG